MNAEKQKLGFVHDFVLEAPDGSVVARWREHNLIPQEGIDLLIQAPFGDTPPVPEFYVGLFQGNYVPTLATKAKDIPTHMAEYTAYAEEARPRWNRSYNSAGTYDNTAAPAEFTLQADRPLYGAFLASMAAKTDGGGVLLSVVRFASPKPASAGLTLKVTSGITYVPTSIM